MADRATPPDADELEQALANEERTRKEARAEAKAAKALEEGEPLPEEKAVSEAEAAILARVAELRNDHPELSEADILETLKQAREELEADRRKAILKRVLTDEKARLRRQEGLVVGASVLDEMVHFRVSLRPWQNPARINGEVFHDGWEYDRPRHIANQLQEMSEWGFKLDRELRGESWAESYRRPHHEELSGIRGHVNTARQLFEARNPANV